jgi:molybdate transport system substrate-binding protein
VRSTLCCWFFALLAFCVGSAAEAAEIRVLASPALSAAFKALAPAVERETGDTLNLQYGLQAEQQQKIQAGDFDVAIVPAAILDAAIKQGKVAPDTRTPLAHVDLGVGARSGAVKPDISSNDAFRRAMVSASSVAYVVGEASGKQVTKDFESLGIADIMKMKTKVADTVAHVWQAVARGDAEVGFGLTSNIVSAPGVELVGLFPPELQYSVVMTAGVGTTAQLPDAAKMLIRVLRGPVATSALQAAGLTPVAP